jgi:sterol 24-C-methyltransferase
MSSQALLRADEARDSAFDKVLHGTSSTAKGGVRAMLGKDNAAHAAAMQEYFQHWDNKDAKNETEDVRQSRTEDYASLTRQ